MLEPKSESIRIRVTERTYERIRIVMCSYGFKSYSEFLDFCLKKIDVGQKKP
jgi:hypothetical protein